MLAKCVLRQNKFLRYWIVYLATLHKDLLYWIISSVLKGTSSNCDLHTLRNTLYNEMSQSNAHYSQTTLSKTPAVQLYEQATSSVAGDGYPYKTPVPPHVNNGGNDKWSRRNERPTSDVLLHMHVYFGFVIMFDSLSFKSCSFIVECM